MDQQIKNQQTLEQQLAAYANISIPENKTIQDIFGPIEEWILNLEGRTLLLNPLEKAWYYYDTLHKTWERTGFGPGEAEFVTVENRLGFRLPKPEPTPGNAPEDATILQQPTPEEDETLLRPALQFALEVLAPEFSSPVPVTGDLVIGRGTDCDICLDDKLSSRSHAKITWDGKTLSVEDLDTTNGTQVNGAEIQQPTPLNAGDMIRVGRTVLRVLALERGEG